MKTGYKMIVSGILGGAVAIVAVAVLFGMYNLRQPAPKPTGAGSSVTIKLVSSKPFYSLQENQVCSTVQQMLQAPTATVFDTSGFVQYVYAKAGVRLPRTIAEQAQVGITINSPDQLERGDLVFFNLDTTNHTVTFDGIYLGSNRFAAFTTHVRTINISDPYWIGKFLYGRRVL